MFIKIAAFLLACIILSAATSCATDDEVDGQALYTTSTTSWAMSYNNMDELCSDSYVDIIAFGEIDRIISVESEMLWPERNIYMYFTDFAFKIDRILKGKAVEEVVVHQTGAEDGKMEISDDPLFKTGERYILFLHEYETGRYSVAGGPDGRFKVVGDKIYSMNYFLTPADISLPEGLDVNGMLKDDFVESIIAKVGATD